jgi:hypothetical protein
MQREMSFAYIPAWLLVLWLEQELEPELVSQAVHASDAGAYGAWVFNDG